MRMSATMIC